MTPITLNLDIELSNPELDTYICRGFGRGVKCNCTAVFHLTKYA